METYGLATMNDVGIGINLMGVFNILKREKIKKQGML